MEDCVNFYSIFKYFLLIQIFSCLWTAGRRGDLIKSFVEEVAVHECFLFVVFYNVVLFGMAIIDEGDFDLFVGLE